MVKYGYEWGTKDFISDLPPSYLDKKTNSPFKKTQSNMNNESNGGNENLEINILALSFNLLLYMLL